MVHWYTHRRTFYLLLVMACDDDCSFPFLRVSIAAHTSVLRYTLLHCPLLS
jgi:hypothetical protein